MFRLLGKFKHTGTLNKDVLCQLVLRQKLKSRHVSGVTLEFIRCASSAIDSLFPSHHVFAERHIGPNEDEKKAMLEYIGVEVSYIRHIICFICSVFAGSLLIMPFIVFWRI